MTKPDHIFNLERRFKAIEKEIGDTLLRCSIEDPNVRSNDDLERAITF